MFKAVKHKKLCIFSLEFGQNFWMESLYENGLIEVTVSTRKALLSLHHLISSSVRTKGSSCLCFTNIQHFDGSC
jgi:hypothetical protein